MLNTIQGNNRSSLAFCGRQKTRKKYTNIALPHKISEIPASQLGIFRVFSAGKKEPQRQKIKPNYFFIRMYEYERDFKWANSMVKIANRVSDMVSEKQGFMTILDYICEETNKINPSIYYGKLKGDGKTCFSLHKENSRGFEYWDRYQSKIQEESVGIYPESNNRYKKVNTCGVVEMLDDLIYVVYPICRKSYETGNLDFCKRAYNELISKEEPTQEEILETCATIQWLIYQECPFLKGNDSIANLLARGIMHSYDLELSPVKEGVSLDFEAFDTDLDEYIKKYPTFFEKYPRKIN